MKCNISAEIAGYPTILSIKFETFAHHLLFLQQHGSKNELYLFVKIACDSLRSAKYNWHNIFKNKKRFGTSRSLKQADFHFYLKMLNIYGCNFAKEFYIQILYQYCMHYHQLLMVIIIIILRRVKV